jgi:hypothetical protein
MRWMKWAGVVAAIILVIACFLPWVTVESRGIVVSGVEAGATRFGKPGYFHFFMCAFFLVFSFTPRIWAKRMNLVIVAMNFAWALRNYFVISACEAGECPKKQLGLLLVGLTSTIMLLASLFPDMKLPKSVRK